MRRAGSSTAALSAHGAAPATHYVSTGLIDEAIAQLLADADALHAACVAAGAQVTLAQCQALVSSSDVSEQPPFEAFDRLGLQLVTEEV